MRKKKKVSSNIQTNHTLGEYQRYFSHLLAKGKLKRYSLSEKSKLNPKRQYWKITNEKGETYFYELPKYIKPGSDKSAYSVKRVMHRRPARVAIAIFAGAALISFTSAIVTRRLNSNINVDPQPYDPSVLIEALKEFVDWQSEHEGEDATKAFSVSELSTIAMASALYNRPSPSNDEITRQPLLAIGSGKTLSASFIDVYVTNAFIYQPDQHEALEESISYSPIQLPIVPHVGRRDFYLVNDEKVESNPGVATSKVDATWNEKDSEYSKEQYEEKVGKIPDNPFLYSIDNETVLSGSSASKVGDEYHIHIELDTLKGVARYKKRMTYLSGKTATYFYYVKLDFVTNLNLRPISFTANERYDVDYSIPTDGTLTTKFFYDDVPNVPSRRQSFDYSPYLPF